MKVHQYPALVDAFQDLCDALVDAPEVNTSQPQCRSQCGRRSAATWIFFIRKGYCAELDEARKLVKDTKKSV